MLTHMTTCRDYVMYGHWLRILVGFSLLPAVASAGTIYVNNITGDDRANGRWPEIRSEFDGPVATIGRALEVARGTDSIDIANTGLPYHESIICDRPRLSGTVEFPFVIEGNGAAVRGTTPLPSRVWSYVGDGTYRYQPYRKGHYQLVLDDTPAGEVPVLRTDLQRPTLEPLQWCAFRGWVFFRVETGHYIDQYRLEAPRFDVGLGLHNVRHVTVRNLRIEQFRLDGINVSGSSWNIRLENITSTGNGRAGLAVTGTARVKIGRLDLAGNRAGERLILLKGQLQELPEAQMAPPPAAKSWELDSGRYVRLELRQPGQKDASTAWRPARKRANR